MATVGNNVYVTSQRSHCLRDATNDHFLSLIVDPPRSGLAVEAKVADGVLVDVDNVDGGTDGRRRKRVGKTSSHRQLKHSA